VIGNFKERFASLLLARPRSFTYLRPGGRTLEKMMKWLINGFFVGAEAKRVYPDSEQLFVLRKDKVINDYI